MTQNRTTHRSTAGTKLYAVRNKAGQFVDIQTYKRAHGQDVQRVSAAEFEIAMRGPRKSPKRAGKPLSAKARKH